MTPNLLPPQTISALAKLNLNLGIDLLPALTALANAYTVTMEGIPIQQRQASAITAFWLFWPLGKWSLQLAKVPDDVIKSIEDLMKQP